MSKAKLHYIRNGEQISFNKKAKFDYAIEDSIEVGVVLEGAEVKSLRFNGASLAEAHAGVMEGKIYLFNLNIKEYQFAPRQFSPEAKRPRALLMSKKQMNKFMGAVQREGYALVPVSLYFNKRGYVKLELGLGKGKKEYDKRQTIKKRDWEREQRRLLA
ncbi:MAG TPA: SsrA-binding protein SmpB [Alphaproteobacteria bacterium]|nr:SsrA-binding protein [Rhodospirillaceae bacterium]HRJ12377.1 SsrA-binding protein SmpB [Alphaproteobacteria bacterium]